nr:MAG TPA: hypothetical protein [Caudoviricetes sp.]
MRIKGETNFCSKAPYTYVRAKDTYFQFLSYVVTIEILFSNEMRKKYPLILFLFS